MEKKLGWMIHPILPNVFFESYLEAKPFIVSRDQSDYYDELINLNKIDKILRLSQNLCSINVEVLHAEKPIDTTLYTSTQFVQNIAMKLKTDLSKVFKLFEKEKCSIVIDNFSNLSPPLDIFQKTLDQQIGCRASFKICISPANASSFPAAYSTTDIFFLQLHGKSKYVIYEGPTYLPLNMQKNLPFELSQCNCVLEATASPGDIVYIPRGFVFHLLHSNDVSVELKISCAVSTWMKFIADSLREISLTNDLSREGYTVEKMRKNGDPEKKFNMLKKEFLNSLTMEKIKSWLATKDLRVAQKEITIFKDFSQ